MSAYLVSREHVDVLVTAGVCGPRGRTISPDTAWHPLTWFAADVDTWADVEENRRELTFATADELGTLLWDTNIASLRARYADADTAGMTLAALEGYEWHRGYQPTAVEALKALDGYEYQSCEHSEWRASEARRFCDALRRRLVATLDGYAAAPWTWDVADVTAARSR